MPTQRRNNNSNILQQRAYTSLCYHVENGYTRSVANDLLYSVAPIDEAILKLAITKKHPNIIKMLLANIEANESITDTTKQALYETAIDTATKTKDQQIETMVLQLVGNSIKPTRTQQLHQMIADKQRAASKGDHWHIMRTQQVLHQAIIENDAIKIRTILAAGVPIDTTALRIAVTNGNQNIVAMLLTNIQKADQTKISQVIKQKLYTYAAQVAINNHDIATLETILRFNFQVDLRRPILSNIIDTWDMATIAAFLNGKIDLAIKKHVLYMFTEKFLNTKKQSHTKDFKQFLNNIDVKVKDAVLELIKQNRQHNQVNNKIIEMFSESISDDFVKQLKENDTLGTFQDCMSLEFIQEPQCFPDQEDCILEKQSLYTLFKESEKENLKNLTYLIDLISADVARGVKFLKDNEQLVKFLASRGRLLLGNCTIDDILNLNLIKLKDLFINLGYGDAWKQLTSYAYDQPTKAKYILHVFQDLLIQVQYLTENSIKNNGSVASNPHNRKIIQEDQMTSAELFMDVYLIAINRFKLTNPSKYQQWRTSQDSDLLQSLEQAVEQLTTTQDKRYPERLHKANLSLQRCDQYYEQELNNPGAMPTLNELIKYTGLTELQLKKLKQWGIIKVTIPDKLANNIPLTPSHNISHNNSGRRR